MSECLVDSLERFSQAVEELREAKIKHKLASKELKKKMSAMEQVIEEVTQDIKDKQKIITASLVTPKRRANRVSQGRRRRQKRESRDSEEYSPRLSDTDASDSSSASRSGRLSESGSGSDQDIRWEKLQGKSNFTRRSTTAGRLIKVESKPEESAVIKLRGDKISDVLMRCSSVEVADFQNVASQSLTLPFSHLPCSVSRTSGHLQGIDKLVPFVQTLQSLQRANSGRAAAKDQVIEQTLKVDPDFLHRLKAEVLCQ